MNIARDSPSNANEVVTEIFEAIERLARLPYAGRPVPEFRQRGWREVFVYEYRVIYGTSREHDPEQADLFHGKRRLEAKHGAGLQ